MELDSNTQRNAAGMLKNRGLYDSAYEHDSCGTGFVAGIDGYIAETHDGGKTWRQVTGSLPRTHLFSIVSDPAGDTIIVGGNSTLLMSIDNGKIFAGVELKPPISYGWIYGVTPRGKAGYVAVGKKGAIYTTDCDATQWNRVDY